MGLQLRCNLALEPRFVTQVKVLKTLGAIPKRLEFSLAACSRIRMSSKTPHPRHWEALLAL
jgi:hypothetical protein